jgi:hypothetical protein
MEFEARVLLKRVAAKNVSPKSTTKDQTKGV